MFLAAIQQDYTAVKKLAQMADVSSSVIQDMAPKSKNKFDAQIFFTVLNNLRYKLIIERKNSRVQLGSEE